MLGTISLRFRDGTTEKGESLYTLAKRYYGKYPVSGRKVGKKEGDKFKLLTLKQALVEVCLGLTGLFVFGLFELNFV